MGKGKKILLSVLVLLIEGAIDRIPNNFPDTTGSSKDLFHTNTSPYFEAKFYQSLEGNE
jgi:hypothetical protein